MTRQTHEIRRMSVNDEGCEITDAAQSRQKNSRTPSGRPDRQLPLNLGRKRSTGTPISESAETGPHLVKEPGDRLQQFLSTVDQPLATRFALILAGLG